MARKGIREAVGKLLIASNLNNYTDHKFDISEEIVLVTKNSDFMKLKKDHPWLAEKKLVAKPDVLIGKRGKNKLILLDATFRECVDFIKHKSNEEVTIKGVPGYLTHWLIEPFTPHKVEYYIAIVTGRNHDTIYFSNEGGINVEENWDKVVEMQIPILEEVNFAKVKKTIEPKVTEGNVDKIAEFITVLYKFFVDFDFSYLEINPFTVSEGKIVPLDLVAKLDTCADFKNKGKWENVEFPSPFGTAVTKEEKLVSDLDSKTGASLKLKVINPEGRIWTLVAGGGASVVYTDTIADLGYGKELGNYGEYSGNPNKEHTYEYTKIVLDLMTRHKNPKGKILIIGGGIANFTDVAKTFQGIIMALKDYKQKLVENKVRIYVRRGGPNYQEGLRQMKELGESLGVPISVYGPETHMTKVIPMALEGK